MDRYLRVFKFTFEVWGMAKQNRTLFKPVLYNIVFAAPLMFVLAVLLGLTESQGLAYTLLAAGVTALYFIDYFCAGLTTSLIFDQVTTGQADFAVAKQRAKAAASGILIFAAISAAFDLLASYAQERDDILGKVLTSILYAVWTTATFVVMPAMVLEGLSFGTAFSRSKQLMKQDPTNVGTGVIGIAAANYVLGGVVFTLAYYADAGLSHIHPIAGAMAFFTLVNVYWAVSGFLKISYFTCFYLWARECEAKQSDSPDLAPAPLAAALA
ncbi:MAG TPA: DUF6159 family protein [Polyangiaceae bacterium]|nr:DUF6159 family protein [Polyangiaceae bacterium]